MADHLVFVLGLVSLVAVVLFGRRPPPQTKRRKRKSRPKG